MLTIRSTELRRAERLSSGDRHAGHRFDQNASARKYFMSLYYRLRKGSGSIKPCLNRTIDYDFS